MRNQTPRSKIERTFIEFLQKRPRRPFFWLEQNPVDVVWLFPHVQRLLEFLPAFEQQHVDYAQLGNVAVGFKAHADGVAQLRRGDI